MDVFEDTCDPADIFKFERIYNEQLSRTGKVTKEVHFDYAYCLVRSKMAGDIRKGIMLMGELFTLYTEDRRDYLYYLAVGHARIKEYSKALDYCRTFLQIEPTNQQVLNLETIIRKKLNRDGRDGMLIAGGGLLAFGAAAVATGLIVSKLISKNREARLSNSDDES